MNGHSSKFSVTGLAVISIALLFAGSAASAKDDENTQRVPGSRKITYSIFPQPNPLVIDVQEVLHPSDAVIALNVIMVPEKRHFVGMIGTLQGVVYEMIKADTIGLAQNMFEVRVDIDRNAIKFESNVLSDDELLKKGYEKGKPVPVDVGNGMKITYTPWFQKNDASAKSLGTVRGGIRLVPHPVADGKKNIFTANYWEMEAPKFALRGAPPSGPDRQEAQRRYDAFKAKFNRRVKRLTDWLNKPRVVFLTNDAQDEFLSRAVGATETMERQTKFRLFSQPYEIKMSITATLGKFDRPLGEKTADNLDEFDEGE